MTRRHVSLLPLLATISLSACGGDEDSESAVGASDASTPSPSPSATPASGDRDGTPIQIAVGDTQLTEMASCASASSRTIWKCSNASVMASTVPCASAKVRRTLNHQAADRADQRGFGVALTRL